jgi:hypothetical protein
MSQVLKQWGEPPEGFQTGGCGNPRCEAPDCKDPRKIEIEVSTKTYEGTVVILTYVDEEGCQKLAINGFAFAWNDVSRARRYADALFGENDGDDIMREALEKLA